MIANDAHVPCDTPIASEISRGVQKGLSALHLDVGNVAGRVLPLGFDMLGRQPFLSPEKKTGLKLNRRQDKSYGFAAEQGVREGQWGTNNAKPRH